jgi:tetratricopeptide (TPR) repeat protein
MNTTDTTDTIDAIDTTEHPPATPLLPSSPADLLEVQLAEGVDEILQLKSSIAQLDSETLRPKGKHDQQDADGNNIPSVSVRAKKLEKYTGGHTGASSRAHKYIFSIWYASRYGRLDRVQALLERDTPVDALDKNNLNCTALHWACKFGHLNIARLLILHGASVNKIDDDGNTPLHLAAGTGGSLPLVRLLLENAAEVRLLNSEKHDAAKVARMADKLSFAELIERWKPCGGFNDLRGATFEFQRASEASLTFTLPPVMQAKPPPKPVKWVTPSEALNAQHHARVERDLSTQLEGLKIKEHRLGAHHPSIAVTLQRMATLLRELGTKRRQEAVDMLTRSINIFEGNLAALENLREKVEKRSSSVEMGGNNEKNGDDSDSGKGGHLAMDSSADIPAGAKINTNINTTDTNTTITTNTSADMMLDVTKALDPRTNAPLLPIGNTLNGTIRLRREQLADVLELKSELLCANGELEKCRNILSRSVSALRRIAITVSKRSSNSLLSGVATVESIVPPLRWATTLTNLGLVERALGNEAEAKKQLLEALRHVEAHVGITVHAAEILEHIAVGHVAKNERVKSAILRERVLTIVSKYHPASMSLAIAHENLGEDYYALHKYKKSEEQFQSGLVLREHLGTRKIMGESRVEEEEGRSLMSEQERRPPEMKEDLKPAVIGRTVDDVINRLQRRDANRRNGFEAPGGGSSTAAATTSTTVAAALSPLTQQSRAYDETRQPPILSGPKVLLHPDVQRSYINVATAGISRVKADQKRRRKEARVLKKKKDRARKLRIADDKKYIQERAVRHSEGLIKLTGLRE